MRFTSNAAAFILSTVALLSLITPVICAFPATFTNPKTGQTVNAFDTITIAWYVVKRDNLSTVCHHRSLMADITAGSSTKERGMSLMGLTVT